MAGIPRHQGRADPKIGPSDSSDTYASIKLKKPSWV